MTTNTPRSALLAGECFFERDEALALARLLDQCEHQMHELLNLHQDRTRPLQQLMAHHLSSGARAFAQGWRSLLACECNCPLTARSHSALVAN